MKTKIVEVTHGPGKGNLGKFLIAQFDAAELEHEFAFEAWAGEFFGSRWTPQHVWVLDLETGEGALFKHGGYATADLDKHRVWVCPMFEPFLTWFYEQPLDLDALPDVVYLPDAPFAMSGYRRPGPEHSQTTDSSGLVGNAE